MSLPDPSRPSTTKMSDAEAALWRDMAATGSPDARSALFDRYLPLARRIARQHFIDRERGDIEFLDLVQYACAGLLEAIDRFDPTRSIPFAGFARRRIAGSVLDGIATASEYRNQLSFGSRQDRERLRSLLATERNAASVADAYDLFAELATGLALGYMLEESGEYADEDPSAREVNGYESAAWRQSVEMVAQAVAGLPERERMIIRNHYEAGLNFDRISALLGISRGRVSQLHRSALMTLRKRVGQGHRFAFNR